MLIRGLVNSNNIEELMEVQNGALILYILKSGRASDWPSLAKAFGVDPVRSRQDSIAYALHHQICELRDLGLVEFDSATMPIVGPIGVTPHWANLQQALGRPRLRHLAAISGFGSGIAVSPLFGAPGPKDNAADVFVLMPFSDNLRPVYKDHIKKVANTLGLTAARADDFFTHQAVMTDIWTAISHAKWIIADCTGRNPNVFYEIGIAHTLGKNVILLAQSEDDVPFDLRHIRYIQYAYTPPGMQVFEERLSATLSAAAVRAV